jgi:hypothetical protein
MSIVKDVEWSLKHVAHDKLESYLDKMYADGYELHQAVDTPDSTIVVMSKDISVKSDWKTAVGLTTNSAVINKLRQKSKGHANE